VAFETPELPTLKRSRQYRARKSESYLNM
jgi:hypothetical protein